MGLFFNNQDIANAGVTEKAVLYSRSRFSCEPSEIGAAKPDGARLLREAPAAFRRLCVETATAVKSAEAGRQPPSGGCVLKPCVHITAILAVIQPPSGGCVLKLIGPDNLGASDEPAAFRRLCVETAGMPSRMYVYRPAAFRRLCVETISWSATRPVKNPAAFRRLCVETARTTGHIYTNPSSRLQAAVC